jgi:hypothetical protein
LAARDLDVVRLTKAKRRRPVKRTIKKTEQVSYVAFLHVSTIDENERKKTNSRIGSMVKL